MLTEITYNPQILTILGAMHKLANTFVQTGSRYFLSPSKTPPAADYDFFVDISEHDSASKNLKKLGFILWSNSKYTDMHTVAVYRFTADTGKQWIDVQIVLSALGKKTAQRVMLLLGVYEPTSEQWEACIETVLQGIAEAKV